MGNFIGFLLLILRGEIFERRAFNNNLNYAIKYFDKSSNSNTLQAAKVILLIKLISRNFHKIPSDDSGVL